MSYTEKAIYILGQRIAAKEVSRAVRLGELKPAYTFNCRDCGIQATEYDHRDYGKPLEVEPVCHGCNLRRGPAIGIERMPKGSKHRVIKIRNKLKDHRARQVEKIIAECAERNELRDIDDLTYLLKERGKEWILKQLEIL